MHWTRRIATRRREDEGGNEDTIMDFTGAPVNVGVFIHPDG
jgi:hypothetical protein